jgi:hypothetical protein
MLETIKQKYSTEYNKVLAKQLGISWRTLVRKARELGLEKEPNFIEKRRADIVKMIAKVRKPSPLQARKGFVVPNSEQYRFKKGHTPRMATDPELVARVHAKRNETIRRDRIRSRIGLSRLTKFKFY